MQLQQLIYFVVVADQGSFNKAAEKLYTTQPNLSKAIGNLDKEINAQVFCRSNKGVFLTEQGKKLYKYARSIIDQVELIRGLADLEPLHTLSIASYPVPTMGDIVSEFYKKHQNENISIQLVQKRMQKVLELVEEREAEIGFIMNNVVQTKELRHMLNFKGLEYHFIGTDTWYVNLGPNNPLYDRDSVHMEELLKYPYIRRPDDYFSNLSFYLEIDGIPLKRFKTKFYVDDTASLISVLKATDAVRFGPKLSRKSFLPYGIRTIAIANCNVKISVGWVKRKKEVLSAEAAEFIHMVEKQFHSSVDIEK